MRDCLHEAMDVDGPARACSRQSPRAQVQCVARDTVAPSPWSHAILNAMPYTFLDDAPLEERRSRAVTEPARTAGRPRRVDGDAIARGASPRPSPIRATPTSCTI